jgi:hypothetical protein
MMRTAHGAYTGATATGWRNKLSPPKLKGCSFKFYMYKLDPLVRFSQFSSAVNNTEWKYGPLLNPSMNEFAIHEVLVQSPCRTSDPTKADAFYIAFPSSMSYLWYEDHKLRSSTLQEYITALPESLSLSAKPSFGLSFTEGPHLHNSLGK